MQKTICPIKTNQRLNSTDEKKKESKKTRDNTLEDIVINNALCGLFISLQYEVRKVNAKMNTDRETT